MSTGDDVLREDFVAFGNRDPAVMDFGGLISVACIRRTNRTDKASRPTGVRLRLTVKRIRLSSPKESLRQKNLSAKIDEEPREQRFAETKT